MRRLAAEDSDIDIIGMDVIWTAEFAEAGWIKQWTGANREQAREGHARRRRWRPRSTRASCGRRRSPPTRSCSGTARTSSKQPPKTWDEMIDEAKKIGGEGQDRGPGPRATRGSSVWFNSLVASAGGRDRERERQRRARAARRGGRGDHEASRRRRQAAPRSLQRQGGRGAPRLRGRATRPSRSTTRSSTRAPRTVRRRPGHQEDLREHGWARWPARRSRTSRAT